MPFVLSEHLAANVISTALPQPLAGEARSIGAQLIDALAAIHAIDVTVAPLSEIGRPTGYLERQLRRFSSIWDDVATRRLPDMETVAVWLREHRPISRERPLRPR